MNGERRPRRAASGDATADLPSRPPGRSSQAGAPSGSRRGCAPVHLSDGVRRLRRAHRADGADALPGRSRWACSRPSTTARTRELQRGRRGRCCARSPPAPPPPWRSRRACSADRLRSSLAAADDERRRWARELHDETLQGLGGLRLLLSAALRREDPDLARQAMRDAVERIELEIENLRSIITDLRPAALDELGLRDGDRSAARAPARAERPAITAQLELLPAPEAQRRASRKTVEIAVYRLVQEALTNVAKHAAREQRERRGPRGGRGARGERRSTTAAALTPSTVEAGLRPGRDARARLARRRDAQRRVGSGRDAAAGVAARTSRAPRTRAAASGADQAAS